MVTPIALSLATLLDALILSAYYPVILLSFSRFFFFHIFHLELTRPITLTRSPFSGKISFPPQAPCQILVALLNLFLLSLSSTALSRSPDFPSPTRSPCQFRSLVRYFRFLCRSILSLLLLTLLLSMSPHCDVHCLGPPDLFCVRWSGCLDVSRCIT